MAWLAFQPVAVVRRLDSETETGRPLHTRGRAEDRSITAESYGRRDWRIIVRDPRARHATVWIGWTGRQITQHAAIFRERPGRDRRQGARGGVRPQRVPVRITDPP